VLGAFKTVRRGERKDTFTASGVLFLLLASPAIIDTARDALFLGNIAPERLPLVTLAVAAVSLLVSEGHSRITGANNRRNALAFSIAVCGAVTGAFWIGVGHTGSWLLYALYIWPSVLGAVVLLQFWTLLGDLFTISQAKRTYGAIGVGAVSGAIAGNAVATWLASRMPAQSLLLVSSVGLIVAGAATLLMRNEAPLDSPLKSSVAQSKPTARGASYVLAHPYARRIVVIAVLTAAAVTVADYLFKSTVAHRVDAESLGSFFARAYLAFNALSLVIQTFVANLAVRKLGVPLAAAMLPVAMLASGVGTLVLPLLPAILILKGSEGGLRHSLHRTALELLSVPLSTRARGLVKRFVDIVGYRGGQAIASVGVLGLVALREPILPISIVVVVLCALWVIAAIELRRSYVALFRRKLGGQVAHVTAFPELDAASLETVVAALDSDDDREVIAAMEVLESEGKSHLVPKLVLFHPSIEVVRFALALFARDRTPGGSGVSPTNDGGRARLARGRHPAVRAIDRLVMTNPAPGVRAAALAARTALDPDPELIEARLAETESDSVRAAAAVCRVAFFPDADQRATSAARVFSRSDHPATRVAVAEAIGASACNALRDIAIALSSDPHRDVRQAAISAMARLGGNEVAHRLIELMATDETRSHARDVLVELGEPALQECERVLADPELGAIRRDLPEVIARFHPDRAAAILVDRLAHEDDGLVRYRIIRAVEGIVARHPAVELQQTVIGSAIADTLAKAYRYLDYEATLSAGASETPERETPGHTLLCRLMRDKRSHAIGRLFRLLGLAYPGESFSAAYRGITSDRADLRASSVELLDNVLPARFRAAVIGLVDDLSVHERLGRAGDYHSPSGLDYDALLTDLVAGRESAVRHAAAYHMGELSSAAEASC